MQTLSERLKWALDQSGLSQRALSRAAGLQSQRHIGFLASGDRDNPELKTVQAIANALGVSIAWLANGDDPAPSPEHLKAVGDAFMKVEAERKEAKTGTGGEAAEP